MGRVQTPVQCPRCNKVFKCARNFYKHRALIPWARNWCGVPDDAEHIPVTPGNHGPGKIEKNLIMCHLTAAMTVAEQDEILARTIRAAFPGDDDNPRVAGMIRSAQEQTRKAIEKDERKRKRDAAKAEKATGYTD